MTLVKSDGVGFRILGPQDLPQVHEASHEEDDSIDAVNAENDAKTEQEADRNASDPLLEFLERRKRNRELYEHRYSRKAMGLRAYDDQRDYKPLFDDLPHFQYKKSG